MNFEINAKISSLLAACLCASFVIADTVDNNNIANFGDGEPALASEVNGNFNELITQINDNASRIADIESNGLVAGGSSINVDCDPGADGPAAIRDAIDDSRTAEDSIVIQAVGVCDGIRVNNRYVQIVAAGPLTLRSINGDPAAFAEYGRLIFNAFQPGTSITLDGDNATAQTVTTGTYGNIRFLGTVNIVGATDTQVALFSNGQLLILGDTTIGTTNDGVKGLQMEQSLLLFAGLSASSLTINSSVSPLLMDDSVIETFGGGGTVLNVPNGGAGSEIEITGSSSAALGPSNLTVETIRITDNSTVSLEETQFVSGTSAAWNGMLLLDRGSNLRLNVEDNSSDISFVQTGDIEVGVNSNLEAFGVDGSPSTMTLGSGGGKLSAVVGGSAIFNSAVFAGGEIDVLDATVVFSDNSSFSAGTQPSINVTFGGKFIDLDSVDGFLTGDVSECTTGGVAYDSSGGDACPTPP